MLWNFDSSSCAVSFNIDLGYRVFFSRTIFYKNILQNQHNVSRQFLIFFTKIVPSERNLSGQVSKSEINYGD